MIADVKHAKALKGLLATTQKNDGYNSRFVAPNNV